MGSNRATDQVHNDSQKLGNYPIKVMVMVMVRVRVRVRVRVQLPMEQPYKIRIIIN